VAIGLHGSYNDCLKEEATSYKMQRPSHSQPYHTYSEDSRRKLGMYSEKISLDLEEEKELGMLRIISERTLEIDEELSVSFIDWQKAFDRVSWTKLMHILKETGIDWQERRLISNLYMAQSVKVRLNRGETRSVKIGRGVRQGCSLSPILFNLYSECLTKEALKEFGDFKIGGQIIHAVKYAYKLVLLAREE
jgi:hypothetical protein